MKSATHWGFFIVLGVLVADASVSAQNLTAIRSRARALEEQVAEIRGREFKQAVEMELNGRPGFGAYLERRAALPRSVLHLEDLDRCVRKLGLYRGEVVLERSYLQGVTAIGVAAYYDFDADTLFLLSDDVAVEHWEGRLAIELYHGLQDQYFDLNEFFLDKAAPLNADELLARRAVVEGEARYIEEILWQINWNGRLPSLGVLQTAIRSSLGRSAQEIRRGMAHGPSTESESVAAARAARMDSIPGFAVLQRAQVPGLGMNVVNHIRKQHQNWKQGWEHVDRLFTDPPVSTEQILHPEKWLAGETADRLAWPPFEQENLFDEWELMHEDTIGELRWRYVFAEFDMATAGESAAEGWNGDRFAMFRSRDGRSLLYMLYTSWDSDDDATEFQDLYADLLVLKYPSDGTRYTLSRERRDVLVLESDRDVDTDGILAFMRTVRTWDLEAIGALDFDGSGLVDFNDFLLFARNFGKVELASDYDQVYDLNNDGQVNFPDFLEFVRHFGRSTS
jgi:hypothetical protein